jgi:hypothetical protein
MLNLNIKLPENHQVAIALLHEDGQICQAEQTHFATALRRRLKINKREVFQRFISRLAVRRTHVFHLPFRCNSMCISVNYHAAVISGQDMMVRGQ